MKFKLQSYSICEFGQRKDAQGNPHQEDSIFPAHNRFSPSDRLFILCDGMGGHDAGEVASQTVCETMARTILTADPDSEGSFNDALMLRAIDDAYLALDAKDTGAEKKMGTTMTCLKLHSEGATIAHMGDSRVYHIRPGKDGESTQILFMTEDHSLVNDLVKIGELTHEQARQSNQKNVITRAMQPGDDRRCRADIAHITDIRPGDYFYLCSDGMLEDEDMESGRVLRNIFSLAGGDDSNKVKILTCSTKDNHDNHTAIIVHIVDVEGAPAAADADYSDDDDDECEAPVSNPQRGAGAKSRKRKSLSRIVMSIVGVLLIAGAAFALWLNLRPEPEPEIYSDEDEVEEVISELEQTEPVAPVQSSVADSPAADSGRNPRGSYEGRGGKKDDKPSQDGARASDETVIDKNDVMLTTTPIAESEPDSTPATMPGQAPVKTNPDDVQ